jgi:hypothetical protein
MLAFRDDPQSYDFSIQGGSMSEDKFTPGPLRAEYNKDSGLWWVITTAGKITAESFIEENAILYASAPTLHAENKRLTAEVSRWKRHHEEMKERCSVLRERHDLPVDRIPAYEKLIASQAEVDRLKSIVRLLTKALKGLGFLEPFCINEEPHKSEDCIYVDITKLGDGV